MLHISYIIYGANSKHSTTIKNHPWRLELQQYNCNQGICFIDLIIFNYLFGESTLSAVIMHCDLIAVQQEIMQITRSQISHATT